MSIKWKVVLYILLVKEDFQIRKIIQKMREIEIFYLTIIVDDRL